ncbi:MAG: hypothetical protein UX37_C0023G0007 [Microgenomates group bacterium GW2011_GWA2_46_16]|nr:MAG: hypothetical protein UX37_C0023G0007 [Microgenomates group bacterium GW2011_GWA2_46_16]
MSEKNPKPKEETSPSAVAVAFTVRQDKVPESCPYCGSKTFTKRGTRKNKYEVVQLYECKNEECSRTFSPQDVKGKHFPLEVITEGLSLYNLGLTLEETCASLQQKFGVRPEPSGLANWLSEYSTLCRYERLRPYAIKMFSPKDIVEVVTLAHQQLYRFRYHRAKIELMLEEFRNRNLRPLKDFLNGVSSDTPHQYFLQGERMSEIKSKFDKAEMIVRSKSNYANQLASFVLPAVLDNNQRHEKLQRFMIANDSVTVATEVPVYIRQEDIEHMENQLGFQITSNGKIEVKGKKRPIAMPKVLTGHIDLVQVRNGQIHLLDYKPNAAKEKPIEQLTWYALAMSRLTGLRIFEFKCAWFDEKDYFEFYPLHVVKKIRSKRKRNVHFKDGRVIEVPKENILKIV